MDKEVKEALERAMNPTKAYEEYRAKVLGNYPTLRDQFAMSAMTSICIANSFYNLKLMPTIAIQFSMDQLVRDSYAMADQMLAYREKVSS